MDVHLIDGTYELFRHYHAVPPARDRDGQEVAAVRGVVHSLLAMVRRGATHIGVATDHVIESFRNDLWPGYKTGAGIPADLWSQFPLLEDVLDAAGFVVWPMIAFEADDALATAARVAAADPRVQQVHVCSPDKDLAQCVRGSRVVQVHRRTNVTLDDAGIMARFGVPPTSIPDYLALVGDAADGYPGVRGWGAKSAAVMLARYGHLEAIPADYRTWTANPANPAALARHLAAQRDEAFLFRTLATLRDDVPIVADVDALEWTGPQDRFAAIAERLTAARSDAAPPRGRRPRA